MRIEDGKSYYRLDGKCVTVYKREPLKKTFPDHPFVDQYGYRYMSDGRFSTVSSSWDISKAI